MEGKALRLPFIGEDIPLKLAYIWLAGLIIRLIMINLASFFPEVVVDFTHYRLPIAQCILDEGWLYCDCTYNHTPFYPYLAASMLWLAGASESLQVFLINLPLGLGDAVVPLVIFILFRRAFGDKMGYRASAFYALNPIACLEVGLSHWDGFTLLFFLLGLLSIDRDQPFKAGIWVGFGFALKQFPLALFPVFLLKSKNIWLTIIMGLGTLLVVLLFFLPFLLNCPETLIDNLLNHPIWKGKASLGVGTLKSLFENLGIPNAKVVWFILFLLLLGVPSFFVSKKNYLYYAGIVVITLAFFTFVTHRQLLIWCMPFLILLTLERKAYYMFVLLIVAYAIRVIKPDWYFGLLYLGVGVWYYVACFQQLRAKRFEMKGQNS